MNQHSIFCTSDYPHDLASKSSSGVYNNVSTTIPKRYTHTMKRMKDFITEISRGLPALSEFGNELTLTTSLA